MTRRGLRALHGLLMALSAAGLVLSVLDRGAGILAYYTQWSAIAAFLSSALFCALRPSRGLALLRHTAVCMLLLSWMMALGAVITGQNRAEALFFSGSGLFHHLLCPLLSTLLYVVWEEKPAWKAAVLAPLAATFFYGAVMLLMNALRLLDGPYPFFRVYRQSPAAIALWSLLICLGTALMGGLVRWFGRRVETWRK